MHKSSLPSLGFGVGYRLGLDHYVTRPDSTVEWLEVMTDQFIPSRASQREKLRRLAEAPYVLVPHGVGLSLASLSPMQAAYVRDTCDVVRRVRPPWFTDHLGFSRLRAHALPSLFPPYRDDASARRVAARIRHLQEATGTTFLFENLATLADPGGAVDEPEYMNRIAESADCGMLLDLMNLRSRCHALGRNPYHFVDALDLDRVVQVHVAGGRWENGLLQDTHSEKVDQQTWDLLTYLSSKTHVNGVLLEWDAGYPASEDEIADHIESELDAARLAVGTPSTQLPDRIADRRLSADPAPRISPMSFDGQGQLEASFDGAYATIGHEAQAEGLPAPAAPLPATEAFEACSQHDQQVLREFLSQRWAKRLEFLAAPFRASIHYLAQAHGWDRERVGRSLDATFPRLSSDEERLGFRCSETHRFRDFVSGVARQLQDPVLGHLISYEATLELLTLRSTEELPRAAVPTLSLSTHAALFQAPFDVVSLHTALGDPDTGTATMSALLGGIREQNTDVRVAIVAPPDGGVSIYQMDAQSFDRLRRLTGAETGREPAQQDVPDSFLESALSAGIVTAS
jgi:uncharacterized protein